MAILESKAGLWRVFRLPDPNDLVVFGVDTASGKENANESVATGLSVKDGHQVCILAGQYTPELIAEEVEKAARSYYYLDKDNPSEIAIEREFHGQTIITILRERAYPSIYFHAYHHVSLGASANEYGWDPRKYRQVALDWLQRDIGYSLSDKPEEKARAVWLHDPDTIKQHRRFEQNRSTGKYEAARGQFDDRVTAMAVANFVRNERMSVVAAPVVEEEVKKTHLSEVIAGLQNKQSREMGQRQWQ